MLHDRLYAGECVLDLVIEFVDRQPRYLFGLAALGDVYDRTDISQECAVLTEPRCSGVDGPGVLTITPTLAVFEAKRFALGFGLEKSFVGGCAVVALFTFLNIVEKFTVDGILSSFLLADQNAHSERECDLVTLSCPVKRRSELAISSCCSAPAVVVPLCRSQRTTQPL